MSFLKNIFSSFIGVLLAFFVVIIVFVLVLVGISVEEKFTVKEQSVLVLDVTQNVKDFVANDDMSLKSLLHLTDEIGFNQLIKAVEVAKTDYRIKAISIKNIPEDMGWAQLSSLRKALEVFKNTGKKVYAYNDFYTQKNYYLASVADKIYMSPVGFVELRGLHSEVLFFKNFQEKYGVKMEVIRHGKYKSAVEPFINDQISKDNKIQITALIQSIWKSVEHDIVEKRKVNLEQFVNNLSGKLPSLALKYGVLDGLVYEDQFDIMLSKASAVKKLHKLTIADYIQGNNGSNLADLDEKSSIAVVYAQGDIVYGKGDENTIGNELMIATFNKLADDSKVKAIVLRIDSPGGSALASDLIWHAIEKAKLKKPVVVSMGNVAASGGYYIACNAKRIFAEPTTITGSIGVFGMLPNASKLTNQIGVNSTIISTHQNGGYFSVFKPLSESFKVATKDGIEFIYNTFLQRVANGRNLPVATVDKIAQGRVWTGLQAKNVGLVDEIGGLTTAINYTKSLVKNKNLNIEEYPKYEDDLGSLFTNKFSIKVAEIDRLQSNPLFRAFEKVEVLMKDRSVQARLPFELVIQ